MVSKRQPDKSHEHYLAAFRRRAAGYVQMAPQIDNTKEMVAALAEIDRLKARVDELEGITQCQAAQVP